MQVEKAPTASTEPVQPEVRKLVTFPVPQLGRKFPKAHCWQVPVVELTKFPPQFNELQKREQNRPGGVGVGVGVMTGRGGQTPSMGFIELVPNRVL